MNTLFKAYDCQLYYNYGHLESLCESLLNDIENKNNIKILKINNQSYSEDIGENMKGITKRKDGRYVIRKTINGIRITKYATNINEAKKIYTKLKKNIINKQTKQNKIILLEQWTEQWIEKYKKPFVKSQTLSGIKGIINKINKEFGKTILNELTSDSIQIFFNKLEKSRTKERTQTYFNAILQKAEDLSLIKKNPFKLVIRDKKGKWKRDSFNFKQQELIIKNIKGTNIEHEIMIYLQTGCRPKELPNKENFDFENNIVEINGTKNENALKRNIPMSKEFSQYIKNYLKNHEIVKEDIIVKEFKEICKTLNIDNPNLYRLRHTFATNHFTLGTNVKYVQKWMGHYSVSLTMDTYTDIDETSSKEKIRELYNNFYYEKQ